MIHFCRTNLLEAYKENLLTQNKIEKENSSQVKPVTNSVKIMSFNSRMLYKLENPETSPSTASLDILLLLSCYSTEIPLYINPKVEM